MSGESEFIDPAILQSFGPGSDIGPVSPVVDDVNSQLQQLKFLVQSNNPNANSMNDIETITSKLAGFKTLLSQMSDVPKPSFHRYSQDKLMALRETPLSRFCPDQSSQIACHVEFLSSCVKSPDGIFDPPPLITKRPARATEDIFDPSWAARPVNQRKFDEPAGAIPFDEGISLVPNRSKFDQGCSSNRGGRRGGGRGAFDRDFAPRVSTESRDDGFAPSYLEGGRRPEFDGELRSGWRGRDEGSTASTRGRGRGMRERGGPPRRHGIDEDYQSTERPPPLLSLTDDVVAERKEPLRADKDSDWRRNPRQQPQPVATPRWQNETGGHRDDRWRGGHRQREPEWMEDDGDEGDTAFVLGGFEDDWRGRGSNGRQTPDSQHSSTHRRRNSSLRSSTDDTKSWRARGTPSPDEPVPDPKTTLQAAKHNGHAKPVGYPPGFAPNNTKAAKPRSPEPTTELLLETAPDWINSMLDNTEDTSLGNTPSPRPPVCAETANASNPEKTQVQKTVPSTTFTTNSTIPGGQSRFSRFFEATVNAQNKPIEQQFSMPPAELNVKEQLQRESQRDELLKLQQAELQRQFEQGKLQQQKAALQQDQQQKRQSALLNADIAFDMAKHAAAQQQQIFQTIRQQKQPLLPFPPVVNEFEKQQLPHEKTQQCDEKNQSRLSDSDQFYDDMALLRSDGLVFESSQYRATKGETNAKLQSGEPQSLQAEKLIRSASDFTGDSGTGPGFSSFDAKQGSRVEPSRGYVPNPIHTSSSSSSVSQNPMLDRLFGSAHSTPLRESSNAISLSDLEDDLKGSTLPATPGRGGGGSNLLTSMFSQARAQSSDSMDQSVTPSRDFGAGQTLADIEANIIRQQQQRGEQRELLLRQQREQQELLRHEREQQLRHEQPPQSTSDAFVPLPDTFFQDFLEMQQKTLPPNPTLQQQQNLIQRAILAAKAYTQEEQMRRRRSAQEMSVQDAITAQLLKQRAAIPEQHLTPVANAFMPHAVHRKIASDSVVRSEAAEGQRNEGDVMHHREPPVVSRPIVKGGGAVTTAITPQMLDAMIAMQQTPGATSLQQQQAIGMLMQQQQQLQQHQIQQQTFNAQLAHQQKLAQQQQQLQQQNLARAQLIAAQQTGASQLLTAARVNPSPSAMQQRQQMAMAEAQRHAARLQQKSGALISPTAPIDATGLSLMLQRNAQITAAQRLGHSPVPIPFPNAVPLVSQAAASAAMYGLPSPAAAQYTNPALSQQHQYAQFAAASQAQMQRGGSHGFGIGQTSTASGMTAAGMTHSMSSHSLRSDSNERVRMTIGSPSP